MPICIEYTPPSRASLAATAHLGEIDIVVRADVSLISSGTEGES